MKEPQTQTPGKEIVGGIGSHRRSAFSSPFFCCPVLVYGRYTPQIRTWRHRGPKGEGPGGHVVRVEEKFGKKTSPVEQDLIDIWEAPHGMGG